MKLTFKFDGAVPLVDFGRIPEGHMVYALTKDHVAVIGETGNEIPAEYRKDTSKYDAKDDAAAVFAFRCERPEQARMLAVMFAQLWRRMKGASE